ncbi:Protein ImpG/VasA [Pseudomonas orientalis]|uniref:type VI secretion system baseplate subunit TssF n=1 Tax=Pseudomonas orientalis TaxID=76758 RepID=UPI000F585810|nr:type VI secretion system baseplate subunit TssF [Pseudomonas orientalis]AZE94094.1 Protein ImpG/VasA [Pseudomonas orientalis]
MHSDLLPYYEKELSHLRTLGQEFARQYPKIASRLLMDGDQCEDPHAERLIEAFSFLAARVHKKLDDDFPEIVEAFLEVMYPHYLRPTPSLSIVEFSASDSSAVTDGYCIERHSELKSQEVDGISCLFRTCYPVTIWPVRVTDATFLELERSAFSSCTTEHQARLRISLSTTTDTCFGDLALQPLRFFIDGESTLTLHLYELLFNNVARLTLVFTEAGQRREVALPLSTVKTVGYAAEEGLIDYSERSFLGYRLLHEYFTFPDKFMFFDLEGLGRVLAGRAVHAVEVNLYFAEYDVPERLTRLAQNVNAAHFKLNCAPVVNLFRQQAEPIKLTHTQHEYPVVPDGRQHRYAEVVSIERVARVKETGRQQQIEVCRPFFEPRDSLTEGGCYWIARRRSATHAQQTGTDLSIRLVDRELELIDSADDTLSLTLTCSNRDLPTLLPYGGTGSDFFLERDSVVQRIRCLRKPSPSVRLPQGKGLLWRLVSHLSLNHLSLVHDGRDVLLELLSLYNYRQSSALQKQINGIVSLRSEPTVALVGHPRAGVVRGVGLTLELDESQYIGGGVFLFGQVLDHFFGLYCSLNSFTQLTLQSRQREKRIVQWPPRTGAQALV